MSSLFGGLFSSLGASSKFEKFRLQFTNKNDLETPSERALQKIMHTFEGKDQQTRAQIGYATIVRKINNSQSNNSWVYMLKNLIILDTALQQKLFVQELVELELPALADFKDQDKKYSQLYLDGLVRKFFQLIKVQAKCLSFKRSLFNVDRYQKKEFVEHMDSNSCNQHIRLCEQLFKCIFEVTYYKKYNITQFKIIQWLFLQLLYKLVNVFGIESFAITRALQFLLNQSEPEILQFRKHVQLFHQNSTLCIQFVNEFKWIKGFETINYKEFETSKSEILSYIQDALNHLKSHEEELKVKIEQIYTEEKITVNRKPRQQHQRNSSAPVPRLEFVEKPSKKKTFQNYLNCFSQEWPPKDIITIDLIELMKQQNNDPEFLQQMPILDRGTTLSSYNLNIGSQTTEHLNYVELPIEGAPFRNIFSLLPSEWAN